MSLETARALRPGRFASRSDGTVAVVKRPFWMHQGVEYILGLAAIAAGAQSPKPLLPCLAGVLILLNAASAGGALGAFRLVPRRLHRVFDIVLIGVLVALAVFGGSESDATNQVVLVGMAIILGFITWQTDYSTKVKKEPVAGADRSEQIGRTAGRLTGNAVSMWKHRKPE